MVVFIDGRGSGHQGWRMKQPLYGNFGTVEIDDQIDTMRFLIFEILFLKTFSFKENCLDFIQFWIQNVLVFGDGYF